MPLILRRARCCKCAGCASMSDDPLDERVGTHASSSACCDGGGSTNIASGPCTSDTSCCRFTQTTGSKTSLTVTIPGVGPVNFPDASVMICGQASPGCPWSLAARTTVRAARIIGSYVVEVFLQIDSRVALEAVATLNCGTWNSAWGESCDGFDNYTAIWNGSHDGGLAGVRHEATLTVVQYSGASVVKDSEAICGTSETRGYCKRSGGSVFDSFSAQGIDLVIDASASIIPASGSAYDRYCDGGVVQNDLLFDWSMTPAPTVSTTASKGNAYPC